MRMASPLRNLVLAAHVAASVGWMGAILAYLPLDVAAAASADTTILRASYVGMWLIARYVLIPLAFATVATGIVISLITPWGLFRHYWVVISLALTIFSFVVLLVELATIRALRDAALDASTTDAALVALPSTLPHSVGGTIVLAVVLVLNVYKPQGLTRYGWRRAWKQQQEKKRVG